MAESEIIQFSVENMKRKPAIDSWQCKTRHTSVVLDEEKRLIECATCGQCFEPFEWMMSHHRELHSLLLRIYEAKKEQKKILTDIADRKDELKRIKSRLRYAQKRII